MNWYRRHWYTVGLFVGLATVAVVVIAWDSLEVVQRVLLLNFAVLTFHQFEEYGWPGGEPAIMNELIQPSTTPDRFPLNQNSAMIVNVVCAYPFFLIPVFFPHVIWLGLAQVLFGFAQFVIHGIVTNIKLRNFYNPGLGAVVFGHIPLGIYYIVYVESHGLAAWWNWLLAVPLLMAFIVLSLLKLTYSWLADEHSPYVFADEEMHRWHVDERMAALPKPHGRFVRAAHAAHL